MQARLFGTLSAMNEELLKQAISDEVKAHGEVRPPWRVCPGEHPYSLCWRMGGGEWHIMVWDHWWKSLALDEDAALNYFRRWGLDAAWLAWAGHVVWPSVDEFDDDAVVKKLEGAGIGRYDDWAAAFNADPD